MKCYVLPKAALRNVAAVAMALGAAAPALAQDISWSERYYNPAPLGDDLVLPMPCGGAMTFRPVQTPNAGGAVGDVKVILGQEGDDVPYLNGLRSTYISGGFPVTGEDAGEISKGQYWLAKYEIAQAQWDVVMTGCPEDTPRRRAFVAAVDMTPLQAASFAERYTTWLLQNAPQSLPAAGDTQAYLRLPTETEWEFAARGGLAVEDAAFRAPRAIFDDADPDEFIAHGGTDSAGGRVQAIGTLAPNPLGLHDMLGNAAEIVGTPFSLIRHGRLHGQAGGVVKRGGDARTPLADITSATRFEIPPFDPINLTPTADRFTGARLAIAALSITSSDQAERINEDLARAAEVDAGGSTTVESDVDGVLAALEDTLDTPLGKQRLAVVRDTLDAARAERNAQRDRSIRLIAESGTLICDQVIQRLFNSLAIDAVLPNYDEIEEVARADGDEALLAEVLEARREALESLDRLQAQVNAELIEYTNLVEGLSGDYSLPLMQRQFAVIRPEIENRGARRTQCFAVLQDHLAARAIDGFIDIDAVQQDMRDTAEALLTDPI